MICNFVSLQELARPRRQVAKQVALTTAKNGPPKCRYWDGYVDVDTYKLTTCAHCYKYLFHEGTELMPYGTYLVSMNGTIFSHMTFIEPDVTNKTTIVQICKTLPTKTSCNQWLECCLEAEKCCRLQLADVPSTVIGYDQSRDCPVTWDGFACWERTKAGSSVQQSCPGYIPHAMPSCKSKINLLRLFS